MEGEVPNYGSLNMFEQVALITEWSPLLMYAKQIVSESDAQKKTLLACDALEWLAAKTQSKFDDELIAHVDAIVKSKEGSDFLLWAIAKVEGVKK
jgi:hypothetical protein